MLTSLAMLALLTPQADSVRLPQAVGSAIAQIMLQMKTAPSELDSVFVDVPSFQRLFDRAQGDSTSWQAILSGAGNRAISRTVQALRKCDPVAEAKRIATLPFGTGENRCGKVPMRALLVEAHLKNHDGNGTQLLVFVTHSIPSPARTQGLYEIVEVYRATFHSGASGWTVKIEPANNLAKGR